MKRVIALFLVVALSVAPLSGCAIIQNDHTRTTTEATIFGGVTLAATGALVGAALGGKRGAWIGGLIGSAVGFIAGYFVGKHIADKKKDYADEEAWLDASLRQAEQNNVTLKKYNEELAATITVLDQKIKQLQADYTANKATKQQLISERNNIENSVKENDQVIANIEKEITGQQRILAEVQDTGRSDESALLDAEIAALKRQKAQLEEANKQLASMSARISV